MIWTKAIRTAFASWLTGKTAAGERVKATRILRPWEEDLPVLSVYTLRDDPEKRDESVPSYLHRVDVAVEAAVIDPRTLDTLSPASAERAARELDDLLQQCFEVIQPRLGFPGVCLPTGYAPLRISSPETGYAGTEWDFEDAGAIALGGARQLWTIAHLTEHSEETPAELAPFETINIDWDLVESLDATPEATDTIKPEQPTPEV